MLSLPCDQQARPHRQCEPFHFIACRRDDGPVCVAGLEGHPVGPGAGGRPGRPPERLPGRPRRARGFNGRRGAFRPATPHILSLALGPVPPLAPQPPEGLRSSPWGPPPSNPGVRRPVLSSARVLSFRHVPVVCSTGVFLPVNCPESLLTKGVVLFLPKYHVK